MLLNIRDYIEQKEWSIEESLLCQFFENNRWRCTYLERYIFLRKAKPEINFSFRCLTFTQGIHDQTFMPLPNIVNVERHWLEYELLETGSCGCDKKRRPSSFFWRARLPFYYFFCIYNWPLKNSWWFKAPFSFIFDVHTEITNSLPKIKRYTFRWVWTLCIVQPAAIYQSLGCVTSTSRKLSTLCIKFNVRESNGLLSSHNIYMFYVYISSQGLLKPLAHF